MHAFLARAVWFIAGVCISTAAAAEPLPAFPGAEGFGAFAKGGRGGRVIVVTSLESNGPGSLQEACAAEGPRTIVFAVSGVIEGDVVIEHGELTILGQTAPGAGITIAGSLKTRYRARQPIDDLWCGSSACARLTPAGPRVIRCSSARTNG